MPKNGHKIWLGSFDDPKKAARAHDAALYCLRGNNAVFNFPNEKRPIYPPGSLSNEKIKEIAASFAELDESEPPVTNEVPGNLQDLPCIPPPVIIQVPGNSQDLPYIPPPPATAQVLGVSQYLPYIPPPPVTAEVQGSSQNLPCIPPPATVQVTGNSQYWPYIPPPSVIAQVPGGSPDLPYIPPPPPVTVQVPGSLQNLPCIPVISEMEGAGAGVSGPPCPSRTMDGTSSPEHLFSDDEVLRFMDWLVK